MIETFEVPIPALQLNRTIRVYLPEGYAQTTTRYPVLYMHDGQYVFRDEDSPQGFSLRLEAYLEQEGIQTIVVAIDNNPDRNERINEYYASPTGKFAEQILGEPSPLGGKGDAYIDFVIQELKPLIDDRYRTQPDRTYMAGCSSGAHISVYAACRYPSVIKRLGCLSSGFYRNQEALEQLIPTSDLSHVERVYMDCGDAEAGEGEPESEINLAGNRAIYDLIRQQVEQTKFEIIEKGRHNYEWFIKRVPTMMDFLYQDEEIQAGKEDAKRLRKKRERAVH
ncbi:MAG TPA: alpha/beta hydrolase-fold protein [Bacilli bacterium]|nr:alpha/beta hydrolase-fold protein [Bacilli bacterium]